MDRYDSVEESESAGFRGNSYLYVGLRVSLHCKVNAQVLLQHMFFSILLYISSSNERKVQMKISVLTIKEAEIVAVN